MENIFANLTAFIAVIIGIIAVKNITGFLLKLLFSAIVIVFIYYVYNGGSLEFVNNFISGV